jgi:hypothetical protein
MPGSRISAESCNGRRNRLSGIIAGVAPGAAVVLIVDQFEEIFTLCSDPCCATSSRKRIAALVEGTNNPKRAILIIREDYAQQTFAIAAFKEFAAETDAQFSPPQLTSAELVRVITSAADAVGLNLTMVSSRILPRMLPAIRHRCQPFNLRCRGCGRRYGR